MKNSDYFTLAVRNSGSSSMQYLASLFKILLALAMLPHVPQHEILEI